MSESERASERERERERERSSERALPGESKLAMPVMEEARIQTKAMNTNTEFLRRTSRTNGERMRQVAAR